MADIAFINRLIEIVGRGNVTTAPTALTRFTRGWRSGKGKAEVAVEPTRLVEYWRVLQACVEHDRIVIMQAANTGLTEGSTPSGSYDRPVVVINTLKMAKIHVIEDGRQIISLPGATLFDLERKLQPLGREPHSVIGSSTIGASITGGVCNNSGGALLQRGQAYTELACYARVTAEGKLELVNNLGIDLGTDPEKILKRLERGAIHPADMVETGRRASDETYKDRVSDVDADTPARYNADPSTLYEASGCAGKLAVFALRLDTFPAERNAKVLYIGTNDTEQLTTLRRRLLTELDPLPVFAEYLHRDCFRVAHTHGKDTLLLIKWLGTAWLPWIFRTKGKVDAFTNRFSFFPKNMSDKVMQGLTRLLPEVLPKRMLDFHARFEHHLILKIAGPSAERAQKIVNEVVGRSGFFRCSPQEAKLASLHRFAAAGAAHRYGICNEDTVEDILSLDIALRRNDREWFEVLPKEIEADIVGKFHYGHFLCHVFHQDYAIRKGADVKAVKAKMLAILDDRRAEYPAEHNVGHLYEAKPALVAHYETLDPTNTFNPGIGKTPKEKRVIAAG